jgi:RNA-binding protein
MGSCHHLAETVSIQDVHIQFENGVRKEERPCMEEQQSKIIYHRRMKILLNISTWDMGEQQNLRKGNSMTHLTGTQKKYLRGLAHSKKPVVLIGQKQLTPKVFKEIEQALDFHELIKVKCIDQKEKNDKKEIAEAILKKTGCELAGMIGHMLILFRQHPNPEKRKIRLPAAAAPEGSQPPTRKDSAG